MRPLERPLLMLLFLCCGCGNGEAPPSVPGADGPTAKPTAGDALRRGLELTERGDPAGAAQAFREAIALDPGSAEAHLLLGRSLVAVSRVAAGRGGEAPGADGGVTLGRDEGVMQESVRALERAVELDKESAEACYWAGRANHVAGDHARAAELLERALALDPTDGASAKRLGLVHLDTGDLARAREAFRAAEPLLPDDPGIPFQLGNVLVEDDPEGARDAFRRSVAIDPTFASAYHGLITVLARLGDTEGAEQAKADFESWRTFEDRVRTAVARANAERGDASLQLAAGELYLVKHAWADALEMFRRGLALDTTSAQAHFFCGIASRELGELQQARDHLEETVYLEPNALEARLELMRVVGAQEEMARLEELLAETDGAADTLGAAGRVLYADTLLELGRGARAAEHYRAVLAADPSNADALAGLARAEAAGG